MDALLSWVPLALYFMGSLAATSAIGLACYQAVKWIDAKVPDVLVVLEFIFAWIAALGLICLLMSDLSIVGGVVIAAAICGVGTFAERAISSSRQSWADILLRMLFTTGCCVALSFTLVVVGVFSLPRSLGKDLETAIAAGSVMGAFCPPSVIPVFIWVWRSSQLRPGVERHLEKEEHNHVS